MDKCFTVYCHTNKHNGKKYIGITSLTPKARWLNGKGYRGMIFGRAIQKYGWDSFVHEILFTGLSETEAASKEIELIKEYKTRNPKYGYNQSKGGNRPTEKAREILRIRMSGKKNPMYNKPRPENNLKATRKAVFCIETDTVYESVSQASRMTGISVCSISKCCRGDRYTAGKFHWKFVSVVVGGDKDQ